MNQQRPLSTLRRLARERPAAEPCELCSASLASDHQHLLAPPSRQLVCCCDACAILFTDQASGKYRRVPRRIEFLPDFQMDDAQWNLLAIPIAMAFLFKTSPDGRIVALYPSPAGATESLLTPEDWQELIESNPVLREFEPDVEALLVNRLGATREYYRTPIDECFKLVGLIRVHWRGLSGGTEVWQEIARFFADLKRRANMRVTRVEQTHV